MDDIPAINIHTTDMLFIASLVYVHIKLYNMYDLFIGNANIHIREAQR